MNNDKIIEGNIEITRFMGGYLSNHPELNGVKVWHGYDPVEGRLNLPTTLTFHSDWNMLMPVVEKIRKTNVNIGYGISFHIINDECWFGIDNLRHEGFNNHLSDSLIASIWLACIEFINWYNQKKEQ